MRRRFLAGLALVGLVGVLAMAGPIVTVDQPEYDYGTIGLGKMVRHTFTVRNTGDAMLEIFRVRASCGCTTTELIKTRLQPGETVPLEVLVVADHGTIKNVRVYLYTNAPDQDGVANVDQTDIDLTLRVYGDVDPKQAYELAPFELAYDLMLLIDVRDAAAYASNHLAGAVNVAPDQIVALLAGYPKNALIVVYDLAGEAADGAVQQLVSAGYLSSYYLQGGVSRWVEVQGDRYLAQASPLPSSTTGISGGSSGRPFNIGALNADYYVLIDVRDPSDYAAGHLAGAVNAPLSQLSHWIARLPSVARVILYDDDGGSTAVSAYQAFARAGFSRVYTLIGGLSEWIHQYGNSYVIRL